MPKAEIHGVMLHYEMTGTGDPVICIHPPLLTGEVFNYQREQLSDIFRVITFDVRGHGQSDPSSHKLSYSLIVADILGIMDHLGLAKAYLCGYSTGGGVALEAMLKYPGRFLGSILISGMSEISDLYNQSRLWAAITLCRLFGTHCLSTAAIAWGNADSSSMLFSLYRHAIAGDRVHLHQYFEASYSYCCTDRLNEIHAPVLLVYGQKDRSFHRYAEVLHRKLADNELHYIPHAQHQIPTKNPEELHRLVRNWYASRAPSHSSGSSAHFERNFTAEMPLSPWVVGSNADTDNGQGNELS